MPARNIENKKIVDALTSTGGALLGTMAMWSLWDAVISVEELKEKFEEVGLDWDEWGLPEISGQRAFRKAVRATRQESDPDILVRPILTGEEEIVMGIVRESRLKEEKDLRYAAECIVTYDRANEAVKLSNSKNQWGQLLKQKFSDLHDYYVTQDFIRLLTKNISKRLGAICLRSTGGVYFVPHLGQNSEILMKHRLLINAVGNSHFSCYPVFDNRQSQRDLGYEAKRELHEEIASIQELIEEFKAEPPRRDTMKRKLESFQDLKKKAQTYATMLKVKVDDILGGIDDCASQLRGVLQIEEEKAAKVEEEKKSKKKARRSKSKDGKTKKVRAPIKVELDDEFEMIGEDEDAVEEKPKKKAATKPKTKKKVKGGGKKKKAA